MDEDFKEVLFDLYCKSCKHKDLKENEEPCNGCLDNPLNRWSDKPVNYEEKTK